jgi:putative acetyltransferase
VPPSSPHIRAETPTDAGAIRKAIEQAFGRADEAALVERLRADPAFLPGLSLVAEIEGAIIGHILLSRLEVVCEAGRSPGLALAPVSVLPAYQRRGIGSALVREALDRARRAGEAFVIVVGHSDYYPRFGFTAEAARPLEAPWPVPPEAWMAQALRPEGLRSVKGRVEYSAAFAEL